MADAELERTVVRVAISNVEEVFVGHGELIKFDGFLKVYLEGTDEDEEEQKDKPGVIVPGRDEDDDKSGDVDIEDDEKIEEVPQIDAPEVLPPIVLPPKEEEKEREREPVTAFLEDVLNFITAAPTAIRIEGLKLVQRVPERFCRAGLQSRVWSVQEHRAGASLSQPSGGLGESLC